MIEKKTVWAVTTDLEIEAKTALVEDGKVLVAKGTDKNDTSYNGNEFGVIRYFDTEEEAKKWVDSQEQEIRDMVPKVKRFIDRLDFMWDARERMGIKKADYLGSYANDSRSNHERWYNDEKAYAQKLETFIRCRMLNIDGHMIPIDEVKDVKWYGGENAEEYEADEWRAVLTTKDGNDYATCSAEDVRLIWAAIGKVSGSWFIDEDIDYDKDGDDD